MTTGVFDEERKGLGRKKQEWEPEQFLGYVLTRVSLERITI
jgi:hypothetical protein